MNEKVKTTMKICNRLGFMARKLDIRPIEFWTQLIFTMNRSSKRFID